MRNSYHALLLLCLAMVFGSVVSVHAQGINACEISYLMFDFPETVASNQPFTVTTTVTLFSCDVGPVVARVDLSDFRHNLISSSYSWVNSPFTNVTNTVTAPKVGDPNIIYATAYMILPSGQIVGHYMSWFEISVVPSTESTTTYSSVIQVTSQAGPPPTIFSSTTSFASESSTLTLSATATSGENVQALILSSDMPYEIIIVFAIVFIVSLTVLNVRKKP